MSEICLAASIFTLELFSSLCSLLYNDTGIVSAFLLIISCLFSSFAINLNSCNIKLSLKISNKFSSVKIYTFLNLFSKLL